MPGPVPPLEIDVLVDEPQWSEALADVEGFVARVLRHAADGEAVGGDVSVMLTNDQAMRTLNAHWRGKDQATNVLSFAPPQGVRGGSNSLGDLALGLQVLRREAEEQGKSLEAHFAHLLVHGLLHLLGYDHDMETDAERMERRERELLAELGFPDPYEESETAVQ